MSEEETVKTDEKEQVVEPEKNIENKTDSKPSENQVPLATLIAERNKYKAEIAKLKDKADFADELSQYSNLDINGLRKNLEGMKQNRPAPQPQYQAPQTNTRLEQDIADIKARLASAEMEKDLSELSSVLDITEDVKSDILDYARDKGLSAKEAAYARYGDAIFSGTQKKSEHDRKVAGANMAYQSSSAGSGAMPTGKPKLNDLQRQFASQAGIDENEMAILISGDDEAIANLYKKK